MKYPRAPVGVFSIHPEVGIDPADLAPARVAREFRSLVEDGGILRPAGEAKADPSILLSGRYLPRFRIDLFDTRYYITRPSFDDHLGFFVGYVVDSSVGRPTIWPRLFYKDLSLVWRVATHVIDEEDDYWIGKGVVRTERDGDHLVHTSAEETTNLPLEIQGALDAIRGQERPRRDDAAVHLVLRRAPAHRIAPYADFTSAMAPPFNRGRPIAFFERRHDPASLRFVSGTEPDFRNGAIEMTRSKSTLYGGVVRKYRILSRDRQLQYAFLASRRHVWINPPQMLTTEITSYGVRRTDVIVDDDLCVPGFEYHYMDDGELHTQIPPGYAGRPSAIDPQRVDASKWIEAMPVVQRFRKEVLEESGSQRTATRTPRVGNRR